MTYAQKVSRRICADCHGGLLPSEPGTRCDECLERRRLASRRKYKKSASRKAKAAYYQAHRERILMARAERGVKKKLTGECHDCPAPCREDANRCDACSARTSESATQAWAERKAALSALRVWLHQRHFERMVEMEG